MFVERYRAIPGLQEIDAERVLALTSGLSGADMEKVRRETVLEMARLGDAVATEIMLLEQISVVEQGYRRDKPISPQEREMAAWHEAGHAVLAFYLEPDLPVRKISIEARAGAQGAVMFDTELSRTSNASTDWVMNRLCIALAGRYAESRQVGGSGMNSGAGQDMRRATELAYRAIFCWGLDDEVGTLALASGDAAIPDLAALPEWGLKRLRHWMEKAQQQTGDYLEQYWSDVEKIALALLKHDTLDGNTFRALLLAGRNGLDVLKFQNCASPNVLSVRDKETSA
jgi:ATP-dependent Zn protease